MDELRLAVQLLGKEGQNEFRVYMHDVKQTGKTLDLFNIYARSSEDGNEDELKPRYFATKLYGKANMNAYSGIRAALKKFLFPFIIKWRNSANGVFTGEANDAITMGQLFLEHHYPELALRQFNHAESIALPSRQYDILTRLYRIMVESACDLGVSAHDYFAKYTQNAELDGLTCKWNVAKSVVKQKVKDAKQKGEEINVTHFFDDILVENHLNFDQPHNPKFQYIRASITRSVMIATKSYQQLEPYIRGIYNELKEANAFTEADAILESDFIYMLTHALYRNFNFAAAKKLLQEMDARFTITTQRKSIYYAKFMLLSAAIDSFSGMLDAAIDTLHEALQHRSSIRSQEDLVNIHLNLCVYHFQRKEFQKASEFLRHIKLKPKEQVDLMGREWKLKRDMIEMILEYELQNDAASLRLHKKMCEYYDNMFDQKVYNRSGTFLELIGDMLDNGQVVYTKEFMAKIKEAKKGWDDTEDDLHAIAFFCWLKSKMLNRDYYEVLLERMEKPIRQVVVQLPVEQRLVLVS